VTDNVTELWLEIGWIMGGILSLLLGLMVLAYRHRPATPSGSSGHRTGDETMEHEVVRPDGYIDSFARQISEGGGSLPLFFKIVVTLTFLWWLAYLILFWRA
jgi:hypothetical protein